MMMIVFHMIVLAVIADQFEVVIGGIAINRQREIYAESGNAERIISRAFRVIILKFARRKCSLEAGRNETHV